MLYAVLTQACVDLRGIQIQSWFRKIGHGPWWPPVLTLNIILSIETMPFSGRGMCTKSYTKSVIRSKLYHITRNSSLEWQLIVYQTGATKRRTFVFECSRMFAIFLKSKCSMFECSLVSNVQKFECSMFVNIQMFESSNALMFANVRISKSSNVL